jgi:uncharacterized membrane protein YdbT with pleckstrin-like domain
MSGTDVSRRVRSSLGEGEQILWQSGTNARAALASAALPLLLLGTVIGTVAATGTVLVLLVVLDSGTLARVAGVVVFVLPIAAFVGLGLFELRKQEFVVTDRQLVAVTVNFPSVETQSLPHEKIREISVKQNYLGELLGVGTVEFEVYQTDAEAARIQFQGIDDPYVAADELRELLADQLATGAAQGTPDQANVSPRVTAHMGAGERVEWQSGTNVLPQVLTTLPLLLGIVLLASPFVGLAVGLASAFLFASTTAGLVLGGVALLLPVGGYVVNAVYQSRREEFVVTDQKVITVTALVTTHRTRVVPRTAIREVTVQQGPIANLMNVGNVSLELQQTGIQDDNITFEAIDDPHVAVEQLREVLAADLDADIQATPQTESTTASEVTPETETSDTEPTERGTGTTESRTPSTDPDATAGRADVSRRVKAQLDDDETVEWRAKPTVLSQALGSQLVNILSIAPFTGGFAGLFAAQSMEPRTAGSIAVVVGVLTVVLAFGARLLWYWYQARVEEFVVTDDKLVVVGMSGLSTETQSVPRDKVREITVNQGFADRLTSAGNISIELLQTELETNELTFESVENPYRQVERLKGVLSTDLEQAGAA